MTKKTLLALMLALVLVTGLLGGVIAETNPAPEAAPETVETETQPAEENPATEPAEAPAEDAAADAQPEATEAPFSVANIPADRVMAVLNGEEIKMSDLSDMFTYYESMYTSYGYDMSASEMQTYLLQQVMSMVLQEKLILQKAHELGFDQLTDEELQTIQDDAQKSYDNMYDTYLSYMAGQDIPEEQKEETTRNYLEQYGYSVDRLVETAKQQKSYQNLYNDAIKDVAVTEEDVRKAYDDGLAAAKEKYAADLTAYATDRDAGTTIFCVPEGYRTVKHILIKDENAAQIQELETTLAGLKADDPEYASTEAKLAELKAGSQAKLDEIQAKIDAGEDFDKLIEEYGEDGGMKAGAANAETGYYVCDGLKSYVTEFQDAAMALENVGDVSEPVLTSYGYHILRYHSDIPAAEIPYAELSEALRESLVSSANTAAFSAKVNEWAAASDFEIMPLE